MDRPALKGITKVTVFIGVDTLLPVSEDRIRTVVELKLRMAGLNVLNGVESSRDPDFIPFLNITLSGLRVHSGPELFGYAYATRGELNDYTFYRRNGATVPMELWSCSYITLARPEETRTAVERTVDSCIDDFLNEWLKANPKSPAK